MKAALYLRVANDNQNEALSTQEFYLRDWANKQGYEVTSVFSDMTPGTSLDRPGLQALLSELGSGQFDIVFGKGRRTTNQKSLARSATGRYIPLCRCPSCLSFGTQ